MLYKMNLQYQVPTRRDAGHEGCSTGRMQDRKDAVQEAAQEGIRTGVMEESRDSG